MNFRFLESLSPRLAGLLVAATMLYGCGDDAPPEVKEVIRPVKLMTINQGSGSRTLEYPGKVSALQSVELGFEVPGKIVELPIDDGKAVTKGDLLGRLDQADFIAARDAAEANRKAAQSAYERARRIFDQGAGSQAEVDKTLRDIEVAKQDLIKAQKALDDTTLTAPFSGRISRKIADNFQNVQAKQPILLLEDISSLKLDVNLPERDYVRMTPGLTLKQRNERAKPEVQISNLSGSSFAASLISFETAADPVTRTYLATFAFDNPADVNVLPGMTAKVLLQMPGEVAKSGDQGVLVPAAAVVTDTESGPYVWRFDNGTVSKADVTIGDMAGDSIRVLGGLQGGDRIAIAGAAHLREGMQVRPLQQ